MSNKIVSVITGGSSGLGLASAVELSKYGVIIISGRNAERLQAASEKLAQVGIENYTFQCDSANMKSVQKLADFAVTKGDIKYVVNCAGISGDCPDAERRKILEINAIGTINAVKAFYPLIIEGGVQINISSMGHLMDILFGLHNTNYSAVFSKWDSPNFINDLLTLVPESDVDKDLAYTISKVFVTWFTKANTFRYAQHKTRIISVSPGHFDTPMLREIVATKPEIFAAMYQANPAERWGKPEEMGTLIRFLCSPAAAYINGTDILIDGGYTTVNVTMKDEQILN